MKIKSLLIGSAMAAGLTSGAQAADAIVYADPEPMEYVRICDVYGAGFFYIPGTETCLRIGGMMRFQLNMGFSDYTANTGGINVGGTSLADGYNSLARFAPNFDVRSSSDWGTIRGFAEVEFDYSTGATVPGAFGGNAFSGTTLRHAFIDIGDRNFLRIGRNWSPYGIWAGPGGTILDGIYGRRTVNNIAFYFNSGQPSGIAGGGIAPGAGFSGFIALVDNERTTVAAGSNSWRTDVEAGLGFGWQGGFFRVAAAYDSNANDIFGNATNVFSAKAGVQQTFGAITARLTGFYNGNINVGVAGGAIVGNSQNYGLGIANTLGSRWSLLGGVDYAFSPAAKVNLTAQWFDDPHGAGFNDGESARWTVAAGLDLTPAQGLRLRPEVNYVNRRNGVGTWGGIIRLDRTF
jgi:opacity protein-like surface antigen